MKCTGFFAIFALKIRNMKTTNKKTCNVLALLLREYDVEHIVISPGSRNTPLIMAISRMGDFYLHSVIDERSAAFVALGLAKATKTPVALVCTSGSAVLNYAPAVVEAYYSQIPLVVISADRPADMIDQDDGQTIRQTDVLKNFTRKEVSVRDDYNDESENRYIDRKLNEALTAMTLNGRGPVHINVEISEPLNGEMNVENISYHFINSVRNELIPIDLDFYSDYLRNKFVVVAIGPMDYDEEFCKQMCELSSRVTVFAEGISNIRGGSVINNIDEYLLSHNVQEPDVVVTFGGGLVSRLLKEKIRAWNCEHWLVGFRDGFADCFGKLSEVFRCDNVTFAKMLLKQNMKRATEKYVDLSGEFFKSAPWSDIAACNHICHNIPEYYNVHLSNGMAVRYCQSRLDVKNIFCNRGVNGIDGCVSTALGASLTGEDTLLITGDMCLQYDLAALSSGLAKPNFKIAVLCNGDGGIFRIISATKDVAELDEYISPKVNLPIEQLAAAYGFEYYEASNFDELPANYDAFLNEEERPAIIAIKTDSKISAQVMQKYYEYFRKNKQK